MFSRISAEKTAATRANIMGNKYAVVRTSISTAMGESVRYRSMLLTKFYDANFFGYDSAVVVSIAESDGTVWAYTPGIDQNSCQPITL